MDLSGWVSCRHDAELLRQSFWTPSGPSELANLDTCPVLTPLPSTWLAMFLNSAPHVSALIKPYYKPRLFHKLTATRPGSTQQLWLVPGLSIFGASRKP